MVMVIVMEMVNARVMARAVDMVMAKVMGMDMDGEDEF